MSVAEFLDNTVRTSGRVSPHQVLYHYTTHEGATGIISSQTFWSTAHDCTNDEAELISANPIVIAVAKTCQQTAKGAAKKVLDIFLANYPDSMITEVGIVYLSCFSTARDDETQWREYGASGFGICLGVRILEEAGPKFVDRLSVMLEVNYSGTSLREWLREIFEKMCAALARADVSQNNCKAGLSALYRIAAYASMNAKDEKWKSEQEVRLATLTPHGSNIAPSERISATGKVIRYLPVSVRAGAKLIALDEIIIGSNQDVEQARTKFEALLAATGYTPGSIEYPRITVSSVSTPTPERILRSPS